jgi:hypothetical protein
MSYAAELPISPLPGTKRRRLHQAAVAAAILVLFLINLMTISGFPIVWEDEVMQVDPAINFASGEGWRSRAWYSQSAQEFWAANNPLYPALLSGWVKAFGVSPAAVRSFNLFQLSLVTLVLLAAADMAGCLQSLLAKLTFVFALWCGGIMSFTYRGGRADITTMLVFACVAWAFFRCRRSCGAPGSGNLLLFLSCMPIASAGIQGLPYLAALAAVAWLLCEDVAKQLLAAFAGTVAGAIALLAAMFARGVLKVFLSNTFAAGYSLPGTVAQYLLIRDRAATQRLAAVWASMKPARIWHSMTLDGILAGALGVLVVLGLRAAAARKFRLRSAVCAGLLLSVAVPVFMTAAGRYADYYHWMSVAPVVLCAVAAAGEAGVSRRLSFFCLALLAVGAASGLPLDLYRNFRDGNARDYARVRALLRENTNGHDVIYGDPAGYYAAREQGVEFYSISYSGGRGYPAPLEAARFSVLIVSPRDFASVQAKVGGSWKPSSGALNTCSGAETQTDIHRLRRCYNLSVYRRAL